MQGRRHVAFITFLTLVLTMIIHSMAVGAEPLAATSPDGKLEVRVALEAKPQPYLAGERLYYRVSYQGIEVLRDSPLGLDFVGARPFENDFRILGSDRQSHQETWENAFDVKRQIPNNYNQLTISLEERQAPNRRVDLIFRAVQRRRGFPLLPSATGSPRQVRAGGGETGFYFAPRLFRLRAEHGQIQYAQRGRVPAHQPRARSSRRPSSTCLCWSRFPAGPGWACWRRT